MIALLLLLALDGGVLPDATPLGLDVRVQPEEITLGEHLTAEVAIDHDPRDVYSLPGFNPKPLALISGPTLERSEKGGRARTVFRLVLADYDTLEPRLPDLTFHVSGPAGERQLAVRGRPLKLRSLVQGEGEANAEHAHHGPKPPVAVIVRSWLWAGVLAGLAAVVAGVMLFRRYRARRKAVVAAAPVVETPYDELALQRLLALRDQAPSRAQIFELSEVVRFYLGKRLSFDALELTSDELLAALRQRRLIGLDLRELQDELAWQDLVKFAKVDPTADESKRALDRAESLIRHTRPLRTQEVQA